MGRGVVAGAYTRAEAPARVAYAASAIPALPAVGATDSFAPARTSRVTAQGPPPGPTGIRRPRIHGEIRRHRARARVRTPSTPVSRWSRALMQPVEDPIRQLGGESRQRGDLRGRRGTHAGE